MSDVKGICERLREDASQRQHGLGRPDGPAIEAQAADALERAEAVVEAARRWDQATGTPEIGAREDDLHDAVNAYDRGSD